jgi:hypothetical protein
MTRDPELGYVCKGGAQRHVRVSRRLWCHTVSEAQVCARLSMTRYTLSGT